jgi:hypothetical protein
LVSILFMHLILCSPTSFFLFLIWPVFKFDFVVFMMVIPLEIFFFQAAPSLYMTNSRNIIANNYLYFRYRALIITHVS